MAPLIQINPEHPEPAKIQQAAGIILNGGLIAYPTETVYGLGANIFHRPAVNRIYSVKGRSAGKAIIVIVASIHQLKELVAHISPTALKLMEYFWPGALTLVFTASARVPPEICGGGNSIAIRIPANQICLDLINYCKVPLTSTSANFAGAPNPISAQMVAQTIGNHLDLIIDGGMSASPVPSTLLDVRTEPVRLLRSGAIEINQIERICQLEKKEFENI